MYKLLIIDHDVNQKIRTNKNDLILHWDKEEDINVSNRFSIINFAEKNSDYIKKIYLEWIHNIGNKEISRKPLLEKLNIRDKYNAWWHSYFVEKSNYENSPQISDVIKLIAMQEWIKDHKINKIIFYSKNKKLSECIKKFSINKKIIYKWKKIQSNRNIIIDKFFLKKFIPFEIKAIIWFFRKIKYGWDFRNYEVKDYKNIKSNVLFVDYFANMDKKSVADGKFKSSYWGLLVNKLIEESIHSSWLHIPLDLGLNKKIFRNSREILEKLRQFNHSSFEFQNHVLIDCFLSPKIIFETLLDWFDLRKKGINIKLKKNFLLLEDLDLWPLFEDEWKDSIRGVSAIANCYNFNLFDIAFQKYNHKTKLIYLFEGQSWEYAMIQAWRNNQNGEIIGYAHASICYWDLRKFFSSNTLNNPKFPYPDKIALNGKLAKSIFSFNSIKNKYLINLEATRYLYINKYKSKNIILKKFNSKSDLNKKVLLVLFDYNEKFIINQLKILSEIRIFLDNYYLVKLKPHPAKIDFFKEHNKNNYQIIEDSLFSVINDVDVVFTSNTTSAALECFCLGKNIVSLIDKNELNLSPLRNVQGTLFITNSNELKGSLKHFLSIEDVNKKFNNDIFYLNKKLTGWMNLLKDKN